ncbi:MAG: hypothetical protein A2521_08795 [Deltaproteobacteria bacterium RIFOXYD12_FULL_57_12]|nr:MAG: hypothetical protein A2521_08795 [Deltaproteobacteria bacterium RIFOXYD12_FULL_57_12]
MKGSQAKILEKSRPQTSVLDYSREELVALLREKLAAHPDVVQAFLHGSVAGGRAGAWSDLDLIIVARTAEPFIERARAFFNILEIGIPADILVYTPDEFAAMRALTTGFWKGFRENHIQLV